MNKVNIIGCNVSNLTVEELLEAVNNEILKKTSSPPVMLSANVHSLNLARRTPWLKKMINDAELVRNDSAGILLAGKILGIEIKDRMTWADFGWELASYCEKKNLTLFFLGNREGVADKAKKKLKAKYPDLKIVGTHHGYFEKHGSENKKIIDKINHLQPDILVVGFGMPLQEEWIRENCNLLDVGIIMTGGNCFTFLAGEESRAPAWMHKNGLEWLYRFLKEPRRMFGRYIVGNPMFIGRVLLQKMGKKYK